MKEAMRWKLTIKANVSIFSDVVGQKIDLKDLLQGTRVIIKYAKTAEGMLAAESIRILPVTPTPKDE